MPNLLLSLFLFKSLSFGMSGGVPLTQNDPAARSVLGVYVFDKTNKKGNLCTGTIVGKQTVITAAHCFDNTSPRNIDITLAFGSRPYLVLTNKEAQKNTENYRRTNQFLINPNYKTSAPILQKLANDVALIYLEGSFPLGYEALSVVYSYTLYSQPEKALVNGVGRESSTDIEVNPSDLVFKTDVFQTIRDVNLVLKAAGAENVNQISDNILLDFGTTNAPFYLVSSTRSVLHKGDSGSALIQSYYGSLRVIGILKGSLSFGGKEMGSAFTNLHQPQLNRWIHNNIK